MTVHAAASRDGGFTLIEMLVAIALSMTVMGAILALVTSAEVSFQAQGEVADMQQRLRASIDMLSMDVRRAGGIDAPVRPYRVGEVRDDGEAGVYYRPDTISVFYVPDGGSLLPTPLLAAVPTPPVLATRTYYLKADPDSAAFDLMQYDGRESDLPVIDHVASLAFEYVGDAGTIDPAALTDGPWRSDAAGGRMFDADLLRVRGVGVTLRIRSPLGARLVSDMEIRFHIAPRNGLLRPSP